MPLNIVSFDYKVIDFCYLDIFGKHKALHLISEVLNGLCAATEVTDNNILVEICPTRACSLIAELGK
jgi:hypothetical protein